MYYVLTELAARSLGVIDEDGCSIEHAATRAEVAAAAESAEETMAGAYHEAQRSGEDRWVVDEDGHTYYSPPDAGYEEYPGECCTSPGGHVWPSRVAENGSGRCLCVICGADGDT